MNPASSDAQALLEALPHAAWLVALDSRVVTAANAQAGALFGRNAAALLGTPAEQLATSPEDLAWWAAAAAGDHSALDSETVLACANGLTLHARRSIKRLAAPPGCAAQVLVSVLDLSARQRIEDRKSVV